jgi:hypothetical protein
MKSFCDVFIFTVKIEKMLAVDAGFPLLAVSKTCFHKDSIADCQLESL